MPTTIKAFEQYRCSTSSTYPVPLPRPAVRSGNARIVLSPTALLRQKICGYHHEEALTVLNRPDTHIHGAGDGLPLGFDMSDECLHIETIQADALQKYLPVKESNLAALSRDPDTVAYYVIIREVCLEYAVSEDELKSKARTKILTRPRHIAIALVRRHCKKWSLLVIGRKFARDHTTIIHAIRKFSSLTTDPAVRGRVELIERRCGLPITV